MKAITIVPLAGLLLLPLILDQSFSDTMQSSLLKEQGPLALTTANRSFKILVVWEPTEIKPNQLVTFDIKFLNYVTLQPVPNLSYDFVVTKDNHIIKEIENSFSITGYATHTVEFPSSGSFSVKINISGVGEPAEGLNEYVAFDLKVVPEYPLSSLIVMASIIGIMIALTKFTAMSRSHTLLK